MGPRPNCRHIQQCHLQNSTGRVPKWMFIFWLVDGLFLQNSAQRAMVESQKMFEDMIRSIERMRSEVTKLIGINEKAAFNQAEALIERLEQEIDELKKKESGLKQLYSTEDHIHFLQVMTLGKACCCQKRKCLIFFAESKMGWVRKHQVSLLCTYQESSHTLIIFLTQQNFNYLCTPTDDGFIPRVTVNPDFSFAAVRKAVAEIKERLEEFGREELVKISKSGVTSASPHHGQKTPITSTS